MATTFPHWTFVLLPYSRLELPGWGKLLKMAAVTGQRSFTRWGEAPFRRVRGKWHGYWMDLDLRHGEQRVSYFLARDYDLSLQLAIRKLVTPGSTYIDIGANCGMHTLLGAACVGPEGRVIAFEPNPGPFARLEEACRLNHLDQVELHTCGLGDSPGELTMSVFGASTTGTFGHVPEGEEVRVTESFVVPVHRGDDALPADLGEVTFIKTDTEGFETAVLRGMEQTIRKTRAPIAVEVLRPSLEAAGSSPEELFELLWDHGYEGFTFETARHGLLSGHDLHLERAADVESSLGRSRNLLWLHPASRGFEILRNTMACLLTALGTGAVPV